MPINEIPVSPSANEINRDAVIQGPAASEPSHATCQELAHDCLDLPRTNAVIPSLHLSPLVPPPPHLTLYQRIRGTGPKVLSPLENHLFKWEQEVGPKTYSVRTYIKLAKELTQEVGFSSFDPLLQERLSQLLNQVGSRLQEKLRSIIPPTSITVQQLSILTRFLTDTSRCLTDEGRREVAELKITFAGFPEISSLIDQELYNVWHPPMPCFSEQADLRLAEIKHLLPQELSAPSGPLLANLARSAGGIILNAGRQGIPSLAAAYAVTEGAIVLKDLFRKSAPAFVGAAIGTMGNSASGTDDASRKEAQITYLRYLHEKVRSAYEQTAEHLAADVQNALKKLDRDIDSYISGTFINHSIAAALLEKRQQLFLAMPTDTIKLVFDECDAPTREEIRKSERIDRKVTELVADYPHIEGLENIIDHIRNASRKPAANTDRFQLFLSGESGVGKTRFAKRLAQALEIPFFDERFRVPADVAALDPPQGLYQNGKLVSPATIGIDNRSLLTTIPHAIVAGNCTNPMIFFDEAGELMGAINKSGEDGSYMEGGVNPTSSLKKVLSREAKTIASPWMASENIELDFTHTILIFAGNVEPTADALRQRFTFIHFPPLTENLQQTVAESAVESFLEVSNLSYTPRADDYRRVSREHMAQLLWMNKEAGNAGVTQLLLCTNKLMDEVQVRLRKRRSLDFSPQEIWALTHRDFQLQPSCGFPPPAVVEEVEEDVVPAEANVMRCIVS